MSEPKSDLLKMSEAYIDKLREVEVMKRKVLALEDVVGFADCAQLCDSRVSA